MLFPSVGRQGVWHCCLPATHRSVHLTQKFEQCCPIGTHSGLILFCEVYSMAILLLALKLCTLANWSERNASCIVRSINDMVRPLAGPLIYPATVSKGPL
jgi:hypothetical protein